MPETIVILAPHPDDEAIGCGGVIGLHRRRGDRVHVLFLTSGERGIADMPPEAARSLRESEAGEAAAVLKLDAFEFLRLPDQRLDECTQHAADLLCGSLEATRPALVYLPHPCESHPDHAAVLPIARAARQLWPTGIGFPTLLAYEVWSPMTRPGWVEDISDLMSQKLRAIRCYRSQLEVFRYDRAVRGLNAYRGVLGGGTRYAEAFAFLKSTATSPNGARHIHHRTGETSP